MRPNAVALLSVSARHVCGMAETCPLASHVLAEQAAPGNLSGSEGRACAADHALWTSGSNPDRAVRGAWLLRRIHTCLSLGDFGSAAALPGVPPFAYCTGSHRHPITNISGLVRN